MVLLPQAQQPAVLAEALPLGFCAESSVHGTDAIVVGNLGQHIDQSIAHAVGERAGAGEQARSRHWREGNRGLELGVVAAAGALEGLRPTVIEDIFALRVALDVEGYGPQQSVFRVLRQQILRLPAGAPADRLRVLQRL